MIAHRATFMWWRLCPRWPPYFAAQRLDSGVQATWEVHGSAWSLVLTGFGIAMFIGGMIIAFPVRHTGLVIDGAVAALGCAAVISLTLAWLMSRTLWRLSINLKTGHATLEKGHPLRRHSRDCRLNKTELLVHPIRLSYFTSYRSPWMGHALMLWLPTGEYFVFALDKSRDQVLAYAQDLPEQLKARQASGGLISAAF